jgi:hypothetical protein
MKSFFLMAVALGLAACATPEQAERDRLIDRIEGRVKLPDGARGLSSYARYYAIEGDGLVTGIYVPGYEAPDPDDTCEELHADFTTTAVECPPEMSDHRLLAGQRAWVERTNLPFVLDGGCSVITVIYDPKADRIKSATCNGDA